MTPDEERIYIQSHYGTCDKFPCPCHVYAVKNGLDDMVVKLACDSWEVTSAASWDDLRRLQGGE